MGQFRRGPGNVVGMNIRQMLGQMAGLVATCIALLVIIKVRQGVPFDALLGEPALLFDGLFDGPTASSGT